MKRCIIHIGMHKTGSTSIQHSLEGFSDDHFLYAGLDAPNHSLAMYSLFAQHPAQHHIHVGQGRNAAAVAAYASRIRADLERAIAEAEGRALIISGEDISALPPDALKRMRYFFGKRFDEVSIVGYVRPPGGFMASGFQQRVKGGSVAVINLDREYRSYEKRFAKFDEIFGRENVQLWKFDPTAFPKGCAVRDFCARLGIALPARRIVRLNESLPRQAVAFLFTYRRHAQQCGFTAFRAPEGHRLGTLLAKAGGDRFRFSPDVVRPILEKNRADIAWMEARLGQPLDENLGQHRPGDVRAEADLLEPDPEAVRKLLKLLGRAAPKGVKGRSSEGVARLVHAVRLKYATANPPTSRVRKLGARIRKALRLHL